MKARADTKMNRRELHTAAGKIDEKKVRIAPELFAWFP